MRKFQTSTKNDPARIKARFGAIVRTFRQRLGVSQEELAWRAGIHRTYLADVERGQRNVTLVSIVHLVTALGVSLTEFFHAFEEFFQPPVESAPPRTPATPDRTKNHKKPRNENRAGRHPLQNGRARSAQNG